MTAVKAKKALGQHFLVDLNIARKICDALSGGCLKVAKGTDVCTDSGNGAVLSIKEPLSEKNVSCRPLAGVPVSDESVHVDVSTTDQANRCDVLEVGCGMGVLTQFLLRREDIITYGAEIDSESVEYLHVHFPEFTPRLIEGDFLKLNLRERFPNGLKIIGNFPYNISSQIFFKVLENRDLIPECVGMIQKEVAVRLAEPPGSKEYGILSVLLQAWYDIDYLFTVNETVFNPPPKVKSAVIRLRRNASVSLGCDEGLFVQVVKASFGQRRKMIRNSLGAAFGNFGGAQHRFFTQRAEQLSVADFVELTRWVADNRK